MTSNLSAKFLLLEEEVGKEVLEREHEIHTSILAILARRNHFMVGIPGLAKSLQIERICARISDANYFRVLMSKFSTPEEVFGGIDLRTLKDTGIQKRIIDGMLPTANFGFLDEIFKANSVILNAMLTAMNERMFRNGQETLNIPLVSIFGASNEIPENDELSAVWDRLHFRHSVQPLSSSANMARLLRLEEVENPDPILSMADIYQAQQDLRKVTIPDSVIEAILDLRADLAAESIHPTDRRWKQTMDILRAEAWLRDGEEVEINDCRSLVHVLWNDSSQRSTVMSKVLQMIDPMDRKPVELYEALAAQEKMISGASSDNDKMKRLVEVFNKLKKMHPDVTELRDHAKETERKSEYIEQAMNKYRGTMKFVQSTMADIQAKAKEQ